MDRSKAERLFVTEHANLGIREITKSENGLFFILAIPRLRARELKTSCTGKTAVPDNE